MKRLLILLGSVIAMSTYGIVALADSSVAEAPTVKEVVAPPATSTATTTTTLPIPVYSPPSDSHCPQWHETALEAGIPEEDLPRWDYIMWRESRCLTDVHNTYDPMSGSRGLTQVNGFWCRNSRYNKAPNGAGWLELQGIVTHCDDLYDPLTNLLAAKAIFDYGVERGNCPWLPWTTRNTKWC